MDENKKLIIVILAGGSGTRLWPASRESYPKQFCRLIDEKSLLQKTIKRADAIDHHAEIIVVTNEAYYFLCKDQIEILGLKNRVHYLLEPCGKNTAPAIALAAFYAQQYIEKEATLLVLPSDQHIEDDQVFRDTIQKAIHFSNKEKLIVFGVLPTAAKTGYGYIAQGESLGQEGYTVRQFVEKPSKELAEKYLAAGNYYWNSGMFLFTANSYLKELARLAKDIYQHCCEVFRASKFDVQYFRIDKSLNTCRNISVDCAVMESTDSAVMLVLNSYWNDLGCWASILECGQTDSDGNVSIGNVMMTDTKNCLLHSEKVRLVALGITDQIVVSTPDAVLVANKSHSQEVKKIVETLKLQKDLVATEHKRIYRPWGFYECLFLTEQHQVKHLLINPGAAISLQLHQHRCEHWTVVSGQAEVIKGEKTLRMEANQSITIPRKTKHRLSNIGNTPLSIIEIQSGDYLGEDDILRFEDRYHRVEKKEEEAV